MAGTYRIHVAEQLDPRWGAWFDDFTLSHAADGSTTLEGPVVDQAALHTLIIRVHDLGLTLLTVEPCVQDADNT